MPTKRRKTSEPASTPEPKRRVTRSSTQTNKRVAQELPAPDDSPATEPRGSKEPRAPKSKPRSQKTAKPETDPQSVKEGDSASPNYTALTITHNLVKKPIPCHQYTPTTLSSRASSPLVFTHGAGGILTASAVVNFCTGFSSSHPILAFQGSMNLKARTKGFHACIDELYPIKGVPQKGKAKEGNGRKTLLLGGRSMGARAAVIAANEYLAERKHAKTGNVQREEEEDVSVQLILISYPLQGPKHGLRDQILFDLPETVSVLFIIGDKDTMCPLDLLHKTRSKMAAPSQLVIVRGADHGMHVKPASATKETGEETGRVAARWVDGGLEGDVVYIGEGGDT